MTTRKITDLTRLEEPEGNDDLLIRDTSEVEDKRVSVEDLFSEPTVRTLQFDTTAGEQADEEGKLVWRDQDSSLAYRSDGIVIDVGQENVVLIRNDTGSTLPKGASVCVAGSSAQRLSVTLSDASPGAAGCRTLGIVAEEIDDNAFGFVSTFGLLRGVDTSAFDEGDELFISTTPGVLTATPPESPARRVTVGYVVVDGVGNGAIFVTLRRGLTLDEVDDVHAPAPQDGQVLRYVDAEDRYEAETLAAADVGAEPDGAVASHSAETEGVHGIADTSELETQAGAQSKVDDRVPDPSGEPDGKALETDDGGLVYVPGIGAHSEDLFAHRVYTAASSLSNVLAWDDFRRPDGPLGVAPSGQPWIERVSDGSMEISGFRVDGTSGTQAATFAAHTLDLGAGSVEMETIIVRGPHMSASSTRVGVMFHYVDDSNFLWARYDLRTGPRELLVGKTIDGSFTTLSIASVDVASSESVGTLDLSVSSEIDPFDDRIFVKVKGSGVDLSASVTGSDRDAVVGGAEFGIASFIRPSRFEQLIVRRPT